MTVSVNTIKHHEYTEKLLDWNKFRFTFEGGSKFREEYLKQFSLREGTQDFADRKDMTYIPAFAKAAIIEIKNSIFNRMIDIKRIGGSASYQSVIDGTDPGVDHEDSSMNAFMGGTVLPELLAIGKVGIFVDQPALDEKTGTMLDDVGRTPYLYIYRAEEIRSWEYDSNKVLIKLLLQATVDEKDEDLGLVVGKTTEYRYFEKTETGVDVTIYDKDGETKEAKTTYEWTEIPCAIIEISNSLLEDVADYQIAHLNIASSDVAYAWKSNFAFYVEQRDAHDGARMRSADTVEGDTDDGTATKARKAATREIRVGTIRGRSYSKGLDAPAFIHPSPEPLEVSMKKQDSMKREIRQLVQLSVTNMDPRRESAESKSMDARGLESGLSYIAQELERAERQIARIWSMYESSGSEASIRYPDDYTLKTSAQRIAEGKELMEAAKSSPSITYQKEMAKVAVEVTIGNRVSTDVLDTIKQEIDNASVVFVNPEALIEDVEAGLATTKTVSEIRGYAVGEAEKAKVERAERAAAIVDAQTAAKGDVPNNAAARGVPELDPGAEESPDKEKNLTQGRELSVDDTKGVRG